MLGQMANLAMRMMRFQCDPIPFPSQSPDAWPVGMWVQADIRGRGQEGHALPRTRPQQVPGEAIWRLYNARKPFSGRGSAAEPAG